MGISEIQRSANLNNANATNWDFASQPDNILFSEKSCMCCVGFIDMVDSTRITAGLTKSQMSKYYSLFINWVNGIIRGYGGKVVKNTGDGLLFYFTSLGDSSIKTVRNCLNSAITLSILHGNVNKKFISESLPELNYRISLDYGEVSFAQTVDSTTLDIFSTTVNLCVKINKVAEPNKVIIGGDLYRIAKNLSDYDFHEVKETISISNRAYPLYTVSEAKTIDEYS
ncbi:MAG: adenylate/guanylate cyclase domain-containing protein [Nitrososphaeraceae archaeon]|nr:adenylate/guanylate cyclase domain-containing protein [Nitrososphaeraceae archaeon]MDW0177952.1 adenylate/guanylate cyclase domain-containing protein [Nitrososphaeraceae archaeon]MDW0180808.1 adenylate/guanylate cyclase domain-containing protein [Nitrososphaeraceae archaeon]MDW0207433.1 adenylate/guanylate cyclase domain-containing protein [Nitrososphaeraceae archaeon]MDW0227824.1 adenylate/guanylate cyclase domain-containing protein [Nitrososphaeraceae archaeon]